MTEKRYCILCGEEIHSDDPTVVICHRHGELSKSGHPQKHANEIHREVEKAKSTSQPITDITQPWQRGQTLLDTYEVIGKLGQGGMGVVYRVHHKSWDIDLAVKQPKANIFTTEKGRGAFIREAETWVDLDLHPHITSCYYVRSIDAIPHVFAECVEGGSLESWIRQERFNLYSGGLQEVLKRILDITIQFAWGLGYAHDQGLVHQDVKPQNVLMTPEGIVKVTDFGLAKARAGAGGMAGTSSGNAMVSGSLHTLAYRSPEQAKGDPLSHKTDIWSWAVSILEMFNGGVSWMDGQIAANTLESYLNHEPEPFIPPMPVDLANLLGQCFQEDPKQRPWDMLSIAERLLGIYAQSIGQAYTRDYPESTELKADSLNNKAVSMLDLAHDDKAVKNWKAAKANDPHHPETIFNLGYWMWQHGQQTDQTTLEQVDAVIGQNPQRSDLKWLLGTLQAEIGNLDQAVNALEAAWGERQWQAGLCLAACLCSIAEPEKGREILNEVWSSFDEEVTHSLGISTKDQVWSYLQSHPLPWRHLDLTLGKGQYANSYGLLSITPDGKFASACAANETVLFDLESGRLVSTLKKHYSLQTSLVGMALSPDGQRAATLADNKSIVLWDAPNGKVIDTIKGLPEYPGVNAFTPDLHYLVYLDSLHHLFMWDLYQKTCVTRLQIPVEPPQRGYSMNRLLALSADGSLCLLILRNEFFGIRLPEGSQIFRRSFEPDFVHELVMSPDGRYALAGGNKGRLWLWDLKDLTHKSFEGIEHHISALAMTPDAHYAVSCSQGEYLTKDNSVRLWALEKGYCLWTSDKQEEDIYALAISPDASVAYSYGRYGPLQRYVIDAGREENARIFNPLPHAFATPLSGGKVLEIIEQSQDRIMKAQSLEKSGHWAEAYIEFRQIQQESLDPWDENLLNSLHKLGSHGQRSGLRAAALKNHLTGHTGRIFDLGVRPGKMEAVTGGDDYEFHWWDLEKGTCLATLDCEKTSTRAISIDPEGQYALIGGGGMNIYGDFLLRLFSFKEGRFVNKLNFSQHMTLDVAFGPIASIAAAASDRWVTIFNPLNGQIFHQLKGHVIHFSGKRASAGTPICVAFTPDGRNVLSGGDDQTICLWDLSTGKRIRRFTTETSSVEQIRVMSDGRRILSGHNDHVLRVWDIENENHPLIEIDTGGRIENLTLTSDSRFAFTSGEDNSIKLWDLNSHQQCGNLEGHSNLVSGLGLTKDGRWLVSSSWDGTVGIWELDWEYQFNPPR
jgi:WD40 repeat protein/serine/threonine protein kinase